MSSSSMVYFPACDEFEGAQNENSSFSNMGIFNMFTNFFRPASSSRTDSNTACNSTFYSNNQQSSEQLSNMCTTNHQLSEQTSIDCSPTEQQIIDQKLTNPIRRHLVDYKKSEFRRYWMPDSSGNECYECNEKFNTFRRRHHCRLCGQIFCKSCANRQVNGTDLGYNGVLRLCQFCTEQVDAHILNMKRERRENVKSFSLAEDDDVFTNGCAIGVDSDEQVHSTEHLMHRTSAELDDLQNGIETAVGVNDSLDASHSSLCSQNHQLEQLFEEKLQRLLDCLVLREQLSHEWKELLSALSKKVVGRAAGMALKCSDALNVLDFIHIKKLNLPESGPSFELLNGVAFSKSLAHTAMPNKMRNVSLMLLNGPISYERVLEKFSSLEPMMVQEKQYLRLQCERVLSRRASLLLSESSISTAAVDLLMAEGVSVVSNIKSKVMLRIARATCSDILSSLDAQFLQPRIGFVPEFSQREFLTAEGNHKRILCIEHCVGNFGVTVLLKGSSMRELMAAKRVLKFLVLSRYTSRLECAFLSMFNSMPKNLSHKRNESDPSCHICERNSRYSDCSEDENEFAAALALVQLTNSPAINFTPPYLETPGGRQCPLLPYFKGPMFRFLRPMDFILLKEHDADLQKQFESAEEEERLKRRLNADVKHPCLGAKLGEEPQQLLSNSRWNNFRANSALHFRRRIELNKVAKEQKLQKLGDLLAESENDERISECRVPLSSDVLSPYLHQSLAFLYCANSRKSPNISAKTFCMGPYVLQRQFYVGKDTSLGSFLLNCCFNPDYRCRGCERTMADHLRRIVHRNARIEITTHAVTGGNSAMVANRASTASLSAALGPFGGGSGEDETANAVLEDLPSSVPNSNCSSIICWLRCNTCSANSSIVTMPDEVFRLSFAKYVDYLSNGEHWVSPFPSSIDLAECRHCTFHSHSRFFALGNNIACFRVHPVYPLNTLFSPIPCSIDGIVAKEEEEEEHIAIRDIVDPKGAVTPDMGSVIAHSLASEEYAKIMNENEGNGVDFIDLQHSDEHCHYTVKVYFPEQFREFRQRTFADGETKFIQSISASAPWYPQGGKSGAVFFRTEDERFVFKTLSRFELDSLKNCALKYIDYVTTSMEERKLTALCKIFGAYSVHFTNKQTNHSTKTDLIVMEFLFYKRDIKQIWDLKGSLRNRLASTKSDNGGNSSVLLDENYIQNLWRNQIYVSPHSKAALNQAIINDSHFLAAQGIMDYSLLAGICRGDEDEVLIGIVDYMRTYTLDKRVESLVKNALPIANSSTVISPELYCKRFYEAIDGYFAVAPDQWTSDSSFS